MAQQFLTEDEEELIYTELTEMCQVCQHLLPIVERVRTTAELYFERGLEEFAEDPNGLSVVQNEVTTAKNEITNVLTQVNQMILRLDQLKQYPPAFGAQIRSAIERVMGKATHEVGEIQNLANGLSETIGQITRNLGTAVIECNLDQ